MARLTIVITVPDDRAQEILQSVTDHLGYSSDAIPVVSRADFLRLEVSRWIKGVYRAAKRQAANSAIEAAEAEVDAVEFS